MICSFPMLHLSGNSENGRTRVRVQVENLLELPICKEINWLPLSYSFRSGRRARNEKWPPIQSIYQNQGPPPKEQLLLVFSNKS